MAWNDKDIKTLEAMAAAGYSASLIAKAIGKTRNSVIGRAWRSKLALGGAERGRDAKHVKRRARINKGLAAENKYISTATHKPPAPTPSKHSPAPIVSAYKPPPRPAHCGSVTLVDLPDHGCRYIYGEDDKKRYCGLRATKNAYCDGCYKIVYRSMVA